MGGLLLAGSGRATAMEQYACAHVSAANAAELAAKVSRALAQLKAGQLHSIVAVRGGVVNPEVLLVVQAAG
jgi:uncharacterized metal-binding protein